MSTKHFLLAGAAAVGLALSAAQARAAEEVEVIHWWTSGGEAAALQVLRENLEKQGVAWKDAAKEFKRLQKGDYPWATQHGTWSAT